MVIATPPNQRSLAQKVTCIAHRTRSKALPVNFFLDFSNIAIGARNVAFENGDGLAGRDAVRLHAGNLKQLAQRNRPWSGGYAATGLSNQQSPIKSAFEKEGISFEISERGRSSNSEQNVDERIQLQMLQLLRKPVEKGVVVLATGDGNRLSNQNGFVNTLAMLAEYGFTIELMSWRHSLSEELGSWIALHGRLIELDRFYSDITFFSGGRSATPTCELARKLIRQGMT